MGIHYKGILAVSIILIPNIFFFIFPPRNIAENLNPIPLAFTIMEQIGRLACFIIPIIFGKKIADQEFSYLLILMAICVMIYYVCWISFFVNGREYFDLFKPLGFIPIPMAIFPVLYFLLLGIWAKSTILMTSSIIFAVGHFKESWNIYIQLIRIKFNG